MRRRSAAARGSCPGSTGTPATAASRGPRRSRRLRSSSRSASRSSSLAHTAGCRSSRCSPRRRRRRSTWGERALELATRLGDDPTRAHALVNLGTAQLERDPRDTAMLLEAHAIAHAAGDRHEATRALANLGFSFMCWCEPEPAERYARQALAYAHEHEVHTLASYMSTTARLAPAPCRRLGRGRTDGAPRVGARRERVPAARPDGADRARGPAGRSGRRRAARGPHGEGANARVSCSGSLRFSSWRPSGR